MSSHVVIVHICVYISLMLRFLILIVVYLNSVNLWEIKYIRRLLTNLQSFETDGLSAALTTLTTHCVIYG